MSTTRLLISMSLVATFLTGIVGMASLTLYPILLAVEIPPITSTAMITVPQVGAGLGAVISSLKELHHHWQQALKIAVLNAIRNLASFSNNLVASNLFVLRISIAWEVIISLILDLFIDSLIGSNHCQIHSNEDYQDHCGYICCYPGFDSWLEELCLIFPCFAFI